MYAQERIDAKDKWRVCSIHAVGSRPQEVYLFGKLYNNKPLMFMRSGQRFRPYTQPVVLSERLQSINLSILN